jgi:hypothetical protein
MALGVFNPIYRNHAAKGTRDREPWVDGPVHEAIRKKYIETRYRLLPYIYTGMEEASRTGVPLMRPMFLEFPAEAALLTNGEEYMFGSGLLGKLLDRRKARWRRIPHRGPSRRYSSRLRARRHHSSAATRRAKRG